MTQAVRSCIPCSKAQDKGEFQNPWFVGSLYNMFLWAFGPLVLDGVFSCSCLCNVVLASWGCGCVRFGVWNLPTWVLVLAFQTCSIKICVLLYTYFIVLLSAYLSTYLSISFSPSIHLPMNRLINLSQSISLSIYLSIHPSIHPSLRSSSHPSLRPRDRPAGRSIRIFSRH